MVYFKRGITFVDRDNNPQKSPEHQPLAHRNISGKYEGLLTNESPNLAFIFESFFFRITISHFNSLYLICSQKITTAS